MPECECLSGLWECDARSNPKLILFGGAADRRYEDLCDKLATVLWRIVAGEHMIGWIFEYDSWATVLSGKMV